MVEERSQTRLLKPFKNCSRHEALRINRSPCNHPSRNSQSPLTQVRSPGTVTSQVDSHGGMLDHAEKPFQFHPFGRLLKLTQSIDNARLTTLC
jgi:hypothetical protein